MMYYSQRHEEHPGLCLYIHFHGFISSPCPRPSQCSRLTPVMRTSGGYRGSSKWPPRLRPKQRGGAELISTFFLCKFSGTEAAAESRASGSALCANAINNNNIVISP